MASPKIMIVKETISEIKNMKKKVFSEEHLQI